MKLRSKWQIALTLSATVFFSVCAVALPDVAYQRWQLLDGTIHARAKWIYERIHFDPTPMNVVFVGPSRVGQGIDAPYLENALAQRGRPAHVVNFSLPEEGRDLNYTIVKELYLTKRPDLLVIGVTEKPSRFGHPAFRYIADKDDVIMPGYLADANYLSNLIYLPYRQMKLFAAGIFPQESGFKKQFGPSSYLGSSVDTTGSVILPDGSIKEGERPASFAELKRGVMKLERGTHKPLLPDNLRDVEFGDERHYISQIVAMARAHGTSVAFVFIPYYSDKAPIQEKAYYEQFGQLWDARFLAVHSDWYADYGHLTRTGAHHFTEWLVMPVLQSLDHRNSN